MNPLEENVLAVILFLLLAVGSMIGVFALTLAGGLIIDFILRQITQGIDRVRDLITGTKREREQEMGEAAIKAKQQVFDELMQEAEKKLEANCTVKEATHEHQDYEPSVGAEGRRWIMSGAVDLGCWDLQLQQNGKFRFINGWPNVCLKKFPHTDS